MPCSSPLRKSPLGPNKHTAPAQFNPTITQPYKMISHNQNIVSECLNRPFGSTKDSEFS